MHPLTPLIVVPLLIGSAITFALAIYAWGRFREPGVLAFLVTSIGLGSWCMFYAFTIMATGEEGKLFWHRMFYTFLPFVPGPWALFLYQHSRALTPLPKWVPVALTIEPLLFIALTWSNDHWHHWLWTSVMLVETVPDLELGRGWFFWVHTAYSYFFVLAATFIFTRMLWREPTLPRWQVALLGFMAFFPLLVNILHVAGFNPLYPLDLTPVALATTGAASAWYAFRFEIWDLLPAARNAIVESMNDGVIVLDTDYTIADLNPAAVALLGQPRNALISQPVVNVLPDWREPSVQQLVLPSILNSAQNSAWELVLPDDQGQQRYIDLVFSPLYDRTSRLTGSLLTLRNVTRRKLAEQALTEERTSLSRRVAEQTADLRKANIELARVAQMKDEFLASMSHELRTPLNTILGLSEALQEQVYGALSERQVRALRHIEESGRHLLALINDILDVSKIEAGKLTLEVRPVHLDNVCQGSLGLVRHAAMKKRVDVQYTPDPTMSIIQADERRLKQILVNLLSNAVKFTPDGGRIGLTVEGDEQAEQIRFVVWDSGIGIPKEDMNRLFQPFVQLDSRLARQHEGSGLGLALVYRMTELHGGSVTVESTVGEGSRFTVSLPLRELAMEAFIHSQGTAVLDQLQRVVVIDPGDTSVEQLRRYLLELGAETLIVDESLPARHIICDKQPDLVVFDLLLPDRSGWDLLAELQADPRSCKIPVLLLSAMPDATLRERLPDPAHQRVQHLLKPFSRQQLGQTLIKLFQPVDESSVNTLQLAPPPALPSGVSAPYVLIVEDNETNIRTLSDYLTAKAYQIEVARSGSEAMHSVRMRRPDVILMDIQMPGMDGLEVTRLIRNDYTLRTIPVIALTALAMPGDREKSLAAGANDYISKPISLKSLVQLIEKYIHPTNGRAQGEG
jgi:PAS domain S-box-containing protein